MRGLLRLIGFGGRRNVDCALLFQSPRATRDGGKAPDQFDPVDVVLFGCNLGYIALDSQADLRLGVEIADEQSGHSLFQVVGHERLPISDQIVYFGHRLPQAGFACCRVALSRCPGRYFPLRPIRQDLRFILFQVRDQRPIVQEPLRRSRPFRLHGHLPILIGSPINRQIITEPQTPDKAAWYYLYRLAASVPVGCGDWVGVATVGVRVGCGVWIASPDCGVCVERGVGDDTLWDPSLVSLGLGLGLD